MELAKRLGIVEMRAERIIDQFNANEEEVNQFVDGSFLTEEVKKLYISYFTEKLKRMLPAGKKLYVSKELLRIRKSHKE